MLKFGIVGTGGFAMEVLDLLQDIHQGSSFNINENVFFIGDFSEHKKLLGLNVVKRTAVDYSNVEVVIAIGDAAVRQKVVDELPKETKYGKIIHPSAFISPSANVGNDVIISHHCVVSSQVTISDHSHLNYHTCIGHETHMDEYFTSAPGVKISGCCKIGENVYFGTNSSTIQGITVNSNIKVGIGGVVMNSLNKSGTYLFNPTKKIL